MVPYSYEFTKLRTSVQLHHSSLFLEIKSYLRLSLLLCVGALIAYTCVTLSPLSYSSIFGSGALLQ
jgi:hypothetical protein